MRSQISVAQAGIGTASRSTVSADRDEVWNNGKYNIWRFDLSGVLGAHAGAPPATGSASTRSLAAKTST